MLDQCLLYTIGHFEHHLETFAGRKAFLEFEFKLKGFVFVIMV